MTLAAALAALSMQACDSSQGTKQMPVAGAKPPGTFVAPPKMMPSAAGSMAVPVMMVPAGTAGSAAPPTTTPTAGANAPTPSMMAGSGSTDEMTAGQGATDELTSYRAEIVVPGVAPNQEGTVCVQVRLDNPEPINVVRLHNTLSAASHHFIVSKVTDPAGSEQALAPCVAFRGAIRGAPLTITQKKDDEVVLPDGVAYQLGASQVMNLELHYLNVGSETTDVKAQTELFAASGRESLQEATVMLIGTRRISIAPHTTATSGVQFTKLPAGMEDVHFFAITGHTHRFGTNVQVSSAAGANQPSTLLYSPMPFEWDAPEMKHLEPAVQVPAGGGFNLECEWNNPSEQTVKFGESALAEMCFFWAYYYPKKPVANALLDGMDLGPILAGM